ncbi:ATP-binding response regulator [Actomonas aquatica]|uniref:histidine kinase n=1 Tax=Actomonas aquatica TaxID=2866162 RepID=A0ABZ1C480_9BACT|nr:response regulator [Opitutus sp. WL0086]WRQ86180.1 response regulator [Opitutus sp. WL0086]
MNAPIRILVVEDEAILAEDLRESLERQSYKVIETVDNAEDARRVVQESKPDLIMMDIHLAGSEDGISTAASIRQLHDIPIIFLTAHSDQATLDRAKRTSPYGYLVKPFEDQELRAAIETATYRHDADSQLRKMERWLRTTLHSIGDGVITVDLDRRVTFLNPVAEAVTGWTRQAAIGRPYHEVFKLRANKKLVEDALAPVLEDGELLHFDENYTIENRDGELRRVDDSVAPIRNDEGKVTGAIIIFRDATEKWELEQLRQMGERRMQEAQRLESLGVLAAGIAHDFNNLLAIMMGHAEMIADCDAVPAREKDYLAQIKDAGRRAAHLCEQMLSYAESGGFERRPINITPILEQSAKLLPPSLPAGIHVKLDLDPHLPPIDGHAGRIQQLLTNLVLNGLEAMEGKAGNLEITSRAVPTLPDNLRLAPPTGLKPPEGWVCVSIEDEGCGIASATLDRIFDPFFSTKFTGRGLGLAIVFNVLRLHDGGLNVISADGVGTRFDIYLPASKVREAPPPPSAWSADWVAPAGRQALIIDDEDSVRLVLRRHLEKLGLQCHDTAKADEALAIIKATPDLSVIFLDLTMPDITGVELLSRIRPEYPELPVVFVSGFSQESISSILETDDYTTFLQKPFERAELARALRESLR